MRYHPHIDLKNMFELPDDDVMIQSMEKPDGEKATPGEVRSFLMEKMKLGHTFLAMGDCDNIKPDGRCAGHLN